MSQENNADRGFIVEPDGSRVRSLVKKITGHDGEISVIRMRPPSYKEIMTYGDPSAVIVLPNGVLPHEDMGLVETYLEKLSGINALILNQLDYRDALALKDAVLDFFRRASASKSTSSPTP